MAPTAELLDVARVLQRLRGISGQDDAVEAGGGATAEATVVRSGIRK